jgi:predicted nucleic acid-binding Zn ribbon protein
MRWTNEETQYAIEKLKSKCDYETIAKALNRTSDSVRNKLQKLGFGYNKEQKKECLNCKAVINGSRKFCSQSCSAIFNNKLRVRKKQCLFCKEGISFWKKFCDNNCQKRFLKQEIVERIEKGDTTVSDGQYKKYLIAKYGNQCMECGWCGINPITNNVPIQLEHIDGNSENNCLENLKLLCPNCHSLTPTYGALNKGNGRHIRRLRRQQKNKNHERTALVT